MHVFKRQLRGYPRLGRTAARRAAPCRVELMEPRVLLSTYTVTNLNDSGTGSLRDAVSKANANPGPDTINFTPAPNGDVGREITLTSGPLTFSDTKGLTTIDTGGAPILITSQVSSNLTLAVDTGASAQLDGLGVYNGDVVNDGSLTCLDSSITAPSPVIENSHGMLSLRDCTVAVETTSPTTPPLAILSVGGSVSVFDSALDVGSFDGEVSQAVGTLTIVQSTLNDVRDSGLMTVADSTINGSVTLSPSTGVDNATLYNTIVANLINGKLDGHLSAGQAPSSNNLVGSATAAGGLVNGTNGNIVGQSADLVAQGDAYGGATRTLPPLAASPAIGAGSPALAMDYTANPPVPLTLDQRGLPRVVGGKMDIGAVEDQPLLVNAATDNLVFGSLSLAAASRLINAMHAGGTIGFDPAVFTPGSLHTIVGGVTIGNNFGPVALEGPGTDVLAIQGGNEQVLLTRGTGGVTLQGFTLLGHSLEGFQVLLENTGASVGLQKVDFSGAGTHAIFTTGSIVARDCQFTGTVAGGAVYNAGAATFQNCTFADNATTSTNPASGSGGAIYNTGALNIFDCTFTGNSSAHGAGGAIENMNAAVSPPTPSTMTAVNCTFEGNSAAAGAGAIDNAFSPSVAGNACTITNCTIVGNTGGGVNATLATVLNNTIVAGNTAADGVTPLDISGSVSGSNNLVGTGGSGGLMNGVSGNLVGVTDPKLGPLADNGGPTQTVALLAGSPAIDAGSNALLLAGQQPLTVDQRGLRRISNGIADIGAYELQQTRLAVPQVIGGSGATVAVSATLTNDGRPVAGEPVSFMLLGNSVGTATTDMNGVATLKGVSLAGVSPGQYPGAITAAFAGDVTYGPSAGSAELDVAVSDPLPVPVTVNDGSAQRSEVRSLSLKFGQPVALGTGAVTLALLNTGGSGRNDGSAPTDASSALAPPTTSDGGATWVFTFAPNTPFVDPTGSLQDGIYTLRINEGKVINSDGESISGATIGFTFHRLFGDINGDGTVNNADYFKFNKAFNAKTGDAAYDAAFDFNGDGVINNTDYFRFNKNFGKTFST